MTTPTTSSAVGKAARSPEELFPLMEFCRTGKLKEVSEWIAKGNPLDPPQTSRRSRRQSPLQIAIQKGFYALAELLLEGGCDPMAYGNALADAVGHRDVEIARLLLSRGMKFDSVDLWRVFHGGPGIIKLFVEYGLDPTKDYGYFHGLCDCVQPLLFLVKDHKDRFPDLQRQAEMALCHYCREGNLRAVSLLLWAGARPDSKVPDPKYVNDPDFNSSALTEALHHGKLDILKRLKPQDYPECVKTMLDEVWGFSLSQPLIDYLLGLGAVLNTQETGGSGLLVHLLWNLEFRVRSSSESGLEQTIKLIEYVAKLGAKWIPGKDASPRHLRDYFRGLNSECIFRLFRILKESGAATVELLELILASPSFKKRLGPQLKAVEQVLHPPTPRPKPKVISVDDDADTPAVQSRPLPTPEELLSRAEVILLDVVRQSPNTHFTNRRTSETIYAQTARRRLGLPKGDGNDLTPIFVRAAKALNKRLKSFIIEVSDQEWRRSSSLFHARLNDNHEWAEALPEAWEGETPNEKFLSHPATRLLKLLQEGKVRTGMFREREVNSRIGLSAFENRLEDFLKEIVMKTSKKIQWEAEGWGSDRKFKISFDLDCEGIPPGRGLNPALKLNFSKYTRDDVEQTARLFHELLLNAAPEGDDSIYLLCISSYAELRSCFPEKSEYPINGFLEFLKAVPFSSTVGVAYDFRDYARSWFVALTPKVDWLSSLAAIKRELSQPDLSERLGVSEDAAKLLSWIERLRPEELLGRYTPVIEEGCEKRIGIKCPWDSKNFPAYIRMLIEEINERTDYDLRIQPWHEYSGTKTRIYMARKRADLEDTLQKLHWMALQNGVSLNITDAKAAIEALINPSLDVGNRG